MRIVITTANRCPQGILWAPHFCADGSCHCEPRQEEDDPTRARGSSNHETKAFARQAATAAVSARR
jgi:hypothetical protein